MVKQHRQAIQYFEVTVKNEILGDSKRIMSMDQLMTYNVCALACAKAAAQDGKAHSMGMWTVSPVKNTDRLEAPGKGERE